MHASIHGIIISNLRRNINQKDVDESEKNEVDVENKLEKMNFSREK